MRRTYMPPPALAANLSSQTRVVALNSAGALLSYSKDGAEPRELMTGVCTSPRVYVPRGPNGLTTTICDLDGDGQNEVLALTTAAHGTVTVTSVDPEGRIKFQIEPIEGTYEPELGAVGTLGPGKGSWFVVRYRRKFESEMVVAYDGKTGKEMWRRDFFGPKREPATKFMMHIPTAVIDVDGDGADDLLADSENWYGIISVKDNRDITPAMVITAAVPGHWGAYATPITAKLTENGPQRVFFSHAFGLTLLTSLEGKPIWHYGLTRDTTHASYPAVGDLDGDGKLEFITVQKDGKLICYGADAIAQKCPMCPANEALREANYSGQIRWTFSLKAPVSDFIAADLDGDGKVEALCGAGDGRLYALKEDRGKCTILWSVDFGRVVGSPILADLYGDGKAEIIVPTEDGKLHCLGRTKPR
jgi:outer membrane protein assembly factor BamB